MSTTEKEKLLSSLSSYGATITYDDDTKSKPSIFFTSTDSITSSIWGYPESDLLSIESDRYITISEIKHEINKAKRAAFVTLILTILFTSLSFIASHESGSAAAFGFAFESLLAGMASLIILWRFWSVKEVEIRQRKRELIALFIIVVSLLFSGISVGFKSIRALVCTEKQKKSRMLLVLSSISVVVYVTLFAVKYRIARRLSSRALRTDAIDALCAALLALSIVVTTSTREFTTKVWFLDSIIALGVALFSFCYGLYSLLHFTRLFQLYRKRKKAENLPTTEHVLCPAEV